MAQQPRLEMSASLSSLASLTSAPLENDYPFVALGNLATKPGATGLLLREVEWVTPPAVSPRSASCSPRSPRSPRAASPLRLQPRDDVDPDAAFTALGNVATRPGNDGLLLREHEWIRPAPPTPRAPSPRASPSQQPEWQSARSPPRSPRPNRSPAARAALVERLVRSTERRRAARAVTLATVDNARRAAEAEHIFDGVGARLLRGVDAPDRAASAYAIRSVVARTHLCRTELDFRRLVNGSYQEGCDEGAPVRRGALRAWLRRAVASSDGSDGDAARTVSPPRFDGAIAWIFCGGRAASLARWRKWLADAEAQRAGALAEANARHGARGHLHGAAAVGGHSAVEHALSRLGALRADEGLPWAVDALLVLRARLLRGRGDARARTTVAAADTAAERRRTARQARSAGRRGRGQRGGGGGARCGGGERVEVEVYAAAPRVGAGVPPRITTSAARALVR